MKPPSRPRNAFYAQSGGVTAVINASAAGVIETARAQYERLIEVFREIGRASCRERV